MPSSSTPPPLLLRAWSRASWSWPGASSREEREVLALPKSLARNDMSPRYRAFRWTVRTLGVLLLGFEVKGEQRVPGKGPVIVAANHRRFLDPVFVSMALPRRLRWMAKKELFAFPFG